MSVCQWARSPQRGASEAASVIEFATTPDPIFMAIFTESLTYTRWDSGSVQSLTWASSPERILLQRARTRIIAR